MNCIFHNRPQVFHQRPKTITSVALVIQLFSVSVLYLLQLLFAQWMGADEYGLYELAIAIATVLAFLGGFGLSETVLRFIPEYKVKQDWAHLRGIIWSSWVLTLLMSLVISLGGTGLLLWITTFHSLDNLTALILGIWAIPILAIAKLQLEIARAIHQMTLAYVPSFILHPLLLMGVALVLKICVYFNFVKTAVTIGILLGTKEVGIYNAGFKTAGWVSFSLMAVNAIAAPLFASLYAEGNLQELQRMVSVIARWIFLPALLMAIALVNFAEPILGLFGQEFIAAKWVIAAIALGQLVNVGSGSVGYW